MGYETKLIIGRAGMTENELAKGEPELDGGSVYRPTLKNDKGDFIKTGRQKTYFQTFATIDLCKCGSNSAIHNIDRVNKDESHYWYFYDGDTEIKEDRYGDEMKPVEVAVVIEALKKNIEKDEYRRFKWALALLESMKNDEEGGITVLLYGH